MSMKINPVNLTLYPRTPHAPPNSPHPHSGFVISPMEVETDTDAAANGGSGGNGGRGNGWTFSGPSVPVTIPFTVRKEQ